MTLQELRAKVHLGLKICERLERSTVIPAAVLKRCLPSAKKILCQARLNLLQSDLFASDLRSLQDIEAIILEIWLELEMLIAWNNGSLFDKIRDELYKFSACPFCGAEVEIDANWSSGHSRYEVVNFPCACLTGNNSFDPRQERFGLYSINDIISLVGLFTKDAGSPFVILFAYYCSSLNEEAKAPFGWRIMVEVRPEYYFPLDSQLTWEKIESLPTVEAVRVGRIIEEISCVKMADLRHRLLRGELGQKEIADWSERFLMLKEDFD